MSNELLLDAIGEIGDDLILSAAATSRARRKARRWLGRLAAAMLAVLAVIVFLRTPPGRAFADYVYENLIQKLFPTLTQPVTVEGMTSSVTAKPYGQLSGGSKLANFVIYIDEDYKVVEDENYYRAEFEYSSDSEYYASLPETYLEIVQVPDTSAAQLAEEIAASEDLTLVYHSEPTDDFPYIVLDYQEAQQPDSRIVTYYLRNNGRGGTFRITVQTFLEAAEGHGVRLAQAVAGLQILD